MSDPRRPAEISVEARLDGHASGNVLGQGVQINFGPAPRPMVLVEPVPPRGLASLDRLVSRQAETAALLECVDPAVSGGDATVTTLVAGPAGIGKSLLARHVAATAVERGWFPGGALFVDVHGYEPERRAEAADLFGAMLRVLGTPGDRVPENPGERATAFHLRLAEEDRPVLLVLDNVADVGQIAAALPRQRRHRALVTSRHMLGEMPDARFLTLDRLSAGSAAELIDMTLRRRDPRDARMAEGRAAAARMAELCDHLPLALRIAAEVLAGEPALAVSDLVSDLQDARVRLDGLEYGDLSVRTAFDLSYRHLTPELARMVRLVSYCPGPHFSIEAVAALADQPVAQARRSLATLSRANLIERSADGLNRWRMHELVRLYVRDVAARASAADEAATAVDRLLRHYLAAAVEADAQLVSLSRTPDVGGPAVAQVLAWFETERVNMLAALGLAQSIGNRDVVLRLASALTYFLQSRHHHDDLTTMTGFALRSGFARDASMSGQSTRSLENVGLSVRETGDLATAAAIHRAAAGHYRLTDDLRGEARALTNLGICLAEGGEPGEAAAVLDQAAGLHRRAGDRSGEAVARTTLGQTLMSLRRHDEGVTVLREAVDLFRSDGDDRGQAAAATTLGVALLEVGRHEEAVEPLRRSEAIHRRTGDRHGCAVALSNLGGALRKTRDLGEAAASLERALDLFRDVGDVRGEVGALVNLGLVSASRGNLDSAADMLQRAADLAHEGGMRADQARAFTNLGIVLTKSRRRADALTVLHAAAGIYRELGDDRRHARTVALLESVGGG
ncbi:tetratricopeptide repeat protein [Sphaerisporangium aureirubrum]|uniref:Tetratricopeptide repeat protein n=1 Tax=Sphaerisporangium aureirubrum TaxID=1544736 RepID=A0ABW1NMQ1_9ACTN